MSQSTEPLWQASYASVEKAGGQGASEPQIVLQVNGHAVPAITTDTVATALLRAGHTHFALNAKTGKPLAPHCLMGVCFGCVCTIDGRSGTQACLEPVRHGQIITTVESDR